jgi:DNA-binding response OmpR family regulator
MPTNMNVVVIEDYVSLRITIVKTIEKLGHSAIGLSCAEELDDVAIGKATDLFIIDLNLPEEDGISLTKRIRKANPLIGIIMLTARSREADKVLGYESGADIYLTKPVSFSELTAAITALSRRIHAEKTAFVTDNLILDSSRLVLLLNDLEISVNETEFIILQSLTRAKNQQLEHWQLLEVIGEDLDSGTAKSYLNVRIHRLRQKFNEIGCKNSIKNHHQKGYQLCVNLTVI